MRYQWSVALLSLVSLVALSGAKLRWKCELFDTSQEKSSTRTTFVDYFTNKPPLPSLPSRVPRSPKKCRPRPKNGVAGLPTGTGKVNVDKKEAVVRADTVESPTPEDRVAPRVKYARKQAPQSTELNIGPGFEEGNDPYGRSNPQGPRRFRPTHLKAADELEKPVAEQLDENVMPDFEFDEDDASPSEEDLPWCPEEPEEVTSSDCETSDLSLLSTTQLIELKQKCKVTAPPDRLKLIEN
uniref:Uncharacterized protein n=1 Tax=Caenorhabditis japonica TaxID=281687 RepID=A0A8R1IPA4_CAEJA